MDKYEAGQLVKKTLGSSFDRQRFVYFVKNLLNHLDESKAFHARGYVQEKYKQTAGIIKTYERIGTYTDPEENKIDVLIVYLEKADSIERARTTLRNFAADYLKNRDEKEAGLFAFVSPNQNDWRFSFVKMEYKLIETSSGKIKAKEEFTPAKRYSFLVGEYESSHTAQSCLAPIIQDDVNNPTIKQIENAFNVEVVTKEFFEKYRELFLLVKEKLEEFIKKDLVIKNDFEQKQINTVDFAKKLLGQIVFLYFLQKKGWFGVEKNKNWGTGSKQFLRELFLEKHGQYKNFFNDILEPLFYQALRSDRSYDDHYFSQFNCKIPFLNGGLFDPINDYDWVKTDILLDNNLFSNDNPTKEGDIGDGILDIFDRYNFTVKEDEPLEKEVAIDPEMLGKVFENLLEVKDRKSKGTYYTPREIVHYMCQESLINYLVNECEGKIGRKDIETLIKFGDTTIEHDKNLIDKEKTDEAFKLPKLIVQQAQIIDHKLADIRVCDPAVGSGAFLVGMMTEIIKARSALTSHLENFSNLTLYDFKRQAIEKSLYGVDIDLGAVEIAKLRLWLSLIVDEENIKNIKPLPNLDYKIMQGNSLIEFIISESLEKTNDHIRGELIDQYNQAKQAYLSIYDPSQKKAKRDQINKLIEDIMIYDKKRQIETDKTWQKYQEKQQENLFGEEKDQLSLGALSEKEKEKLSLQIEEFNKLKQASLQDHFEWHLNFNEVFDQKGGFDVVIANPPYVQLQKDDGVLADMYKNCKYQTFERTGDIYALFYEKGICLIKTNGYLCFITSNKWMRAGYGKTLRKFFDTQNPLLLIDLGPEIFENATVDTNILILQKAKNQGKLYGVTINSEAKNMVLSNYINGNKNILPKLGEDAWFIGNQAEQSLKEKIERIGKPLKDWDVNIYRGIVTGLNEAFIIDTQTKERLCQENPQSVDILKPILRGRDIKRYDYEWAGLWMIASGFNIDVPKLYPAVFNYLKQFEDKAKKRDDQGKNWWNLRACTYYHEFEKEKVVYPETTQGANFFLDTEGKFYIEKTGFIILSKTINLFFINGLFCSKLFTFIYKNFYSGVELGYTGYQYNKHAIEKTPIPSIISSNKDIVKQIETIVEKILTITKSVDYLKNPAKKEEVKKYENQIDELVYKLYGLTQEEIEMIEK